MTKKFGLKIKINRVAFVLPLPAPHHQENGVPMFALTDQDGTEYKSSPEIRLYWNCYTGEYFPNARQQLLTPGEADDQQLEVL